RADAEKLTDTAKFLRLAESLVYEKEAATADKVDELAAAYVASVKTLTGSALEAKKSEAQSVRRALDYLGKSDVVPAAYPPRVALDQVAKANDWDAKK
ncbi:MAG: DUF1080 domain-containing protein, partial [Undibacterium sp.]|nr:DUF1080 domain-containing protein [Opitutaceae bacterium]